MKRLFFEVYCFIFIVLSSAFTLGLQYESWQAGGEIRQTIAVYSGIVGIIAGLLAIAFALRNGFTSKEIRDRGMNAGSIGRAEHG